MLQLSRANIASLFAKYNGGEPKPHNQSQIVNRGARRVAACAKGRPLDVAYASACAKNPRILLLSSHARAGADGTWGSSLGAILLWRGATSAALPTQPLVAVSDNRESARSTDVIFVVCSVGRLLTNRGAGAEPLSSGNLQRSAAAAQPYRIQRRYHDERL